METTMKPSATRTSTVIGAVLAVMMSLVVVIADAPRASAAPGDLLGTVDLPGNGESVGGTFDGTHYIAPREFFSNQLDIYLPPAGGNGTATLVATKTVVDAADNPVGISAVSWDSSRGMIWGALGNNVYLIDIGDPTVSGDAVATFQFNPNVGGSVLIDGIAWDTNDDTVYLSPDTDLNVYQFSLGTGGNPPLGTLMNTVAPKNENGDADGLVSGVAIGADNTLYVGRNGAAEIRRVNKTTGDFISTFATTSGRVEDLVCDPATYAPNEAILAKDAFSGLYEAFEVEPGTCPLAGGAEVDKDLRHTNVDFTPTDSETGEPLPAVLGDLLPIAHDDHFSALVNVHPKNGTVQNTNPGQFYGVVSVSGSEGLESFWFHDEFGDQFDINPAQLGGGIEVIVVDSDGFATVLTDALKDLDVSWTVDNEANMVSLDVQIAAALGRPLEADETLMIYLKFRPSPDFKGEPAPGFPDHWENTGLVDVDHDGPMTPLEAGASLHLTEK